MDYTTLAPEEQLQKTKTALENNGFDVIIVDSGADAKAKVLEILPQGGDVLTMTSETLETTGIAKEINTSDKYQSIRNKLNSLDRATEGLKMQQLGAAPEYVVGSVHAITQDGKVIIASNTGSQLPAYAYGSAHVIWVVSTKKLVSNLEDGMNRINEHVLPLESERARKAYGVAGSEVKKLLIMQKEGTPHRIHIILVKENLGY